MPISIVCPSCGKKFRVPADRAGRKATCPECDTRFEVPNVEGEEAGETDGVDERWEDEKGRPPQEKRMRTLAKQVPAWAWAVGAFAFFVVCCGCMGWASSRRDDKIAKADKLFAEGHQAEAVALYKELYHGGSVAAEERIARRIIEYADKLYAEGKQAEAVATYKEYYRRSDPAAAEMLKRIVEYEWSEGANGNKDESGKAHFKESRKWMEKGFEDKIDVPYENPWLKFQAPREKRRWELVKAGPKGNASKAEEVALKFVKRQINFPDTAKFSQVSATAGDVEIDEGKGLGWVVGGKVQAKNAFNVPQTYRFVSIVRLDGDTWSDLTTTLEEDRE